MMPPNEPSKAVTPSAPPAKAKPAMLITGWFLLIPSLIGMLVYAFAYNVGVSTPDGTVANIGFIGQQICGLMFCGVIFLSGLILIGISSIIDTIRHVR